MCGSGSAPGGSDGQRRSQMKEAGAQAAADTHLRREQVRHLFARVAAICSEQADIREGLCRRKKEGEDTPGEGRLVRIERLHLRRLVDVFLIKEIKSDAVGFCLAEERGRRRGSARWAIPSRENFAMAGSGAMEPLRRRISAIAGGVLSGRGQSRTVRRYLYLYSEHA